jgi:hypothetical protein
LISQQQVKDLSLNRRSFNDLLLLNTLPIAGTSGNAGHSWLRG